MAAATIALLSLLSVALPAGATPPDSGFVLPAVRAAAAPLIDGDVAEAEWAGAAVAERFIQYEPRRGSPSEFATEALVLYDAAHLYVAFRVWDPEEPTAQLTRRDAELENDDAVVVVLDSHNDHRSAYYFMTNALGTQADGRVANDGRTVDATWDAPWRSAAARADYGWTVEIAIPLTSIKYAAGRAVTWGINLGRSRRRSLEISFWAGPLEHPYRVSQGGSLVGLDIAPPARRHQLIAYGLSRLQEDARGEWQAGGDLRYALTPELSAYLTANPDFATIEADQEQVNLTRFELQLPEKRPFFLEGAELFRQRIRTFYSRRIGGVDAGGQALGKAGPWTLATLVARGEAVGDTASGTYAVGRFQRDVFGSSNVALTVANRTLDRENRGSAGLDATLFFTKTLGMTAQLIESWGSYRRGTWAYFIRPAYDSPSGHFHVRYTHLGDRFKDHVNAVGFIRDDDRRELDSALRRTFWIKNRTFERLEYGSNYNIYWSQKGILRSWQIDQSLEVEFRNRLSMEAAYREEFKAEDSKLFKKDFRNRQFALEVGYNTREYQSVEVGYRFGRNFDSEFSWWTAAAAYKLTPELSLEYELERLTLDPDPKDESTWIHVVRANQFFTRDLYLRLFYQRKASSDGVDVDVQAVFVYRYRPPFGTFQLAYQHGTSEFWKPSEQRDALFVKLTVVL